MEIQNHGIPEEDKVADFYKKVAPEFGLKIVATCDSHFLKEGDAYSSKATLAATVAKLKKANHKRGKEIFFGRGIKHFSFDIHISFIGHN